VAAASARNGATYHWGGLAGFARDFALRHTPPAQLLGRFDWLYGHDVTSAEL
jgi:hypothetical protein